jgi:hypothetical protein
MRSAVLCGDRYVRAQLHDRVKYPAIPDLLITDRLPLREVARTFGKLDGEDPGTTNIVLDVQDA